MDLKLIQRLIAMMRRGGLAELDLEDAQSGVKVRLKREGHPPAPMVQVVGGGAGGGQVAPMMAGGMAATAPASAATPPVKEVVGTPIQSPMVGTFYRAGSPEAEPFVTVGMRIAPDKVLCIIEAMKVMNEIKSEVSGEVLEILAENGEPVEFGQPLFLVKTD
jgi:acetyl-CoA carboxylase biotin carboxyl carrier protein